MLWRSCLSFSSALNGSRSAVGGTVSVLSRFRSLPPTVENLLPSVLVSGYVGRVNAEAASDSAQSNNFSNHILSEIQRSIHKSQRRMVSLQEDLFGETEPDAWKEERIKLEETRIQDPKLMFEKIMKQLRAELGDNLIFPKEIMWLAGAPGAGKGTMTDLIMEERGLKTRPIVVSDLLNTPEHQKVKDSSKLINDEDVILEVCKELLNPKYMMGALVDGFPRTELQSSFISELYDHMMSLRNKSYKTEMEPMYRRPVYHLVILYCDQETSVKRQLKRGREVKEHNRRVRESGMGQLLEERKTDLEEDAARERYKFFKDHGYHALMMLRSKFPFHFIDSSGPISEVASAIQEELKYQSSLELSEETFHMLSSIPLATELGEYARQELVRRLERYQTRRNKQFKAVIKCVHEEFMHIIRRQALSGRAIIRSENPIFQDPGCVDILLDVLCERGYSVVLDYEKKSYPHHVEPDGTVIFSHKNIFHFDISFEKPKIR